MESEKVWIIQRQYSYECSLFAVLLLRLLKIPVLQSVAQPDRVCGVNKAQNSNAFCPRPCGCLLCYTVRPCPTTTESAAV